MILRNLKDWINRKQYLLGQFFPHLLVFACGIVTAEQMWPVSVLLTMLYLALTVVLRGECLQKQAVLSLTARIAWKLLAGWQSGFCGFFRSDLGCYRPLVIYSRGCKSQPSWWPRRHLGLSLSSLSTTTWGEAVPRCELPSSTGSRWDDQMSRPEAETRDI